MKPSSFLDVYFTKKLLGMLVFLLNAPVTCSSFASSHKDNMGSNIESVVTADLVTVNIS